MLTQERLKELLDYNPKTGIFTRKITTSSNAKKGQEAGSVDKDGYLIIRIDYKHYRAHRLAFLWMLGYLPENQIDHKDRIEYHNWWSNLREANPQCQMRNSGMLSSNTSGIKGISWNSDKNKWFVNIYINKKQKHLGIFSDFIEAAAHRFAAEQCLNWSNCDTDSSAGKFLREKYKGR
jgi:hypothetical protein